jgi:hypothetical protein
MHKTGLVLAGAGVVAMLLLSGCREEEQGRILGYEKGVYLGRPDTALSDSTRDDLRQRIRHQSSEQRLMAGGGPPTSTASSVRPPAGAEGVSQEARDAARQRVLKQGLN